MAARRRNTVLASMELMLSRRPEMTLTLARVFFYIAENPGLSLSELATLCGFTDATASRSIAALVSQQPLVEAGPSPTDARSLAIRLAPAGEALQREIDALIVRSTTIDPRYSREIG